MNIKVDAAGGFKQSWEYIASHETKEILQIDPQIRRKLFNKAIVYLYNNSGQLARNPSLMAKFIGGIPSDCMDNPKVTKILNFLHSSDVFCATSSFNPFYKKNVHPDLQNALKFVISSGNESMAIELIYHGFPVTQEDYLLALKGGYTNLCKAM